MANARTGQGISIVRVSLESAIFRVAFGCFLFCTRAAFEAAGGFDTSLYITEEVALSRALRRLGHFAVLPQRVVTSARKLRALTFRQALRAGWRAIIEAVKH